MLFFEVVLIIFPRLLKLDQFYFSHLLIYTLQIPAVKIKNVFWLYPNKFRLNC